MCWLFVCSTLVCLGPVPLWGTCSGCLLADIPAGLKRITQQIPTAWMDQCMNHSYLGCKFRMLTVHLPRILNKTRHLKGNEPLKNKIKIKIQKEFPGRSICVQCLGSYSTAQEKQAHFLFCRNVKAKELWPWECLMAHIWSCLCPKTGRIICRTGVAQWGTGWRTCSCFEIHRHLDMVVPVWRHSLGAHCSISLDFAFPPPSRKNTVELRCSVALASL